MEIKWNCILLSVATTVINITWPLLDEQWEKVPFKCHSVVRSQWATKKICIWKLASWLVHTHTHTHRGRVEGWACHCSITASFHLMPVLSRQDRSRMKWITYRHHTSPGLSLSLSLPADLAEHRQGNVTLQFTSNMWSSLTEQDQGLQIRSCVSLSRDVREFETPERVKKRGKKRAQTQTKEGR